MDESDRLLLSRIAKPVYGGIGHILMFHRVCPEQEMISAPGLSPIEVSVEQFNRLLDFFETKKYQFLSLDKVLENLLARRQTRFVSITFDDGYLDNKTIAYPILKKRNIPFAIYVTNSFPDRTAVLWQYLLDDAIKQQRIIQFPWEEKSYKLDFHDTAQISAFVATVRELIKDTTLSKMSELLLLIFQQTVPDPYQLTKDKTLSWEQIEEISKDPLVTIGAHTLNHQPLVRMDFEAAHMDILQSKSALEQHLGKKIHHFAYPFGDVSPREVELVYKSGFLTAVTTRMGNIFRNSSHHLLTLPRLNGVEMKEDLQTEIMVNGLTAMTRNRFARIGKV
jgi:peptidoglycan/xylan/chitin deacetylase (PgdA/CDA1 family)